MARLTRPNPVSPVSTPISPDQRQVPATERRSSNPGRVTTPLVYLGRLPANPTDLPDDGVCRIWYVSGALRCNFEGTTYTLAPGGGGNGHDAVTLAADAQVLLNLSTQELGLVAWTANKILAGPTSGGAADPTSRALVEADIPAAIARDSEVTADIATHTAVEAAHHEAMKYRVWIPFALDTIPNTSFTPEGG